MNKPSVPARRPSAGAGPVGGLLGGRPLPAAWFVAELPGRAAFTTQWDSRIGSFIPSCQATSNPWCLLLGVPRSALRLIREMADSLCHRPPRAHFFPRGAVPAWLLAGRFGHYPCGET